MHSTGLLGYVEQAIQSMIGGGKEERTVYMGMICYSNLINSDGRADLKRIMEMVDLLVNYLIG